MTDEQFKELNVKIDSIDKKLDTIIKHIVIKPKDPEQRAGIPAKDLIKGFKKDF